jgi:hypothetical protein
VKEYLRSKKPETLSLEVGARVGHLLEEATANPSRETQIVAFQRRIGNSLFERGATTLQPTFPGGYTVRIGMPVELAQSIFHAAGARIVYDFSTRPAAGTDVRGLLLPDNTMVYLAFDSKTSAITHLATGLGGAGPTPNFSWDSATNLKVLSLKPNPIPRPRY